MRAFWIALACAGAALLLLARLRVEEPGGSVRSASTPQNVILIGVDTLRADHLGAYGYRRHTSPNLDRFARESLVFERCITPTPRTTQAVASLMTGRHPVHSGVRTLLDDLPEDATTLATVLRSHGYETISVVAAGVLRGLLEHGFERVLGAQLEKSARRTTDAAIERLEAARDPHFLWVFYRDPHMPYRPRRVVFDRDYDGPHRDSIEHHGRISKLVFRNRLSARTRKHVVALYDAEIFFTDHEIGRLLAWVDANDPGALVVFTADHGEALGERDYYYHHGAHLDQPSLHVPLMIRGLGVPPRRVDRTVRLLDVMPTVLAGVGIDVSQLEMDGVDLRSVLDSKGDTLEAYSETGLPLMDLAIHAGVIRDATLAGRKRSLVVGNRKLVYVPRQDGVHYELYDLESDPAEATDLWENGEAPELRRRLDAWVARDLEAHGAVPAKALSEEEAARLRALGYLD
jgi:arylsulfatase A-like enzyme